MGIMKEETVRKEALIPEILEMKKQGFTNEEIHFELDISRHFITKVLKENGLSHMRGSSFHFEERNNEIVELLKQGLTQKAIAEKFGIGRSSVSAISYNLKNGTKPTTYRNFTKKSEMPQKTKKPKKKSRGIDNVEAMARENGVSYGIMCAMLDGYLPDRRGI